MKEKKHEQSNSTGTPLHKVGEFGLIELLTSDFVTLSPHTIQGVGDDAAVIQVKDDHCVLLSTDMLVEALHFDPIYSSFEHIGYKAVVVNLSDICAMNALPRHITVSIAISNKYFVEHLQALYKGIHLACKEYDIDLVGGDTVSSLRGLTISISALGIQQYPRIAYRHGAKPGDLLCVTGNLGAAYLGLLLLEREKQLFLKNPDLQPVLPEKYSYALQRQLKPDARTDIIQLWQHQDFIPSALIDVSDGLASDLLHICHRSNVGAIVEESKIPIREDIRLMALDFNHDPITCAMNGGEDYELLFTAPEDKLPLLRYRPDISIIGEIVPKNEGIHLLTTGGKKVPITAQGWQHFSSPKEKK